MVGSISMWSGSIANIPTGWVLCNGSGGTPDLREKFVLCVGPSNALNSTGGSNSQTLTTNQLPVHSHSAGSGASNTAGAHSHSILAQQLAPFSSTQRSGADFSGTDSVTSAVTDPAGAHTHSTSGSTDTSGLTEGHENRPPYYALAFIMAVV